MKYVSFLVAYLILSSCSSFREVRGTSSDNCKLYVAHSCGGKNPYYFTNQYDILQFPERYEGARQFVNNRAAVQKNKKWGYIDKEGNVIIPFLYDWVSSFGEYGFDESVAIVKEGIDKDRLPMFTPCKSGLINDKGELITPWYGFIFPIEKKLSMVNNGTIFKNVGTSLSYSQDGKWGCIDRRGKEIINCQYDLMYPFRDNITFVRKNGKWGCINEKGKEIIPCEYEGGYYKSDKLEVNTYRDTNKDEPVGSSLLQLRKNNIIYMVDTGKCVVFDAWGKKKKEKYF